MVETKKTVGFLCYCHQILYLKKTPHGMYMYAKHTVWK